MGEIENHWQYSLTRRKALAGLAGMLAGSPLLRAQQDPRILSEHKRILGLNEITTAFDFEPIFFANVRQATYDYTAHATESEFTLRRNRQSFDWVDLIPGKAVDPKSVNLSTEILGLKLDYPIFIAPTATQVPMHPDGEAGMHQAATAANTPMIVSNAASLPIDKIAAAAKGPLWFQLYPGGPSGTEKLDQDFKTLEEAQAAGCQAVVVTVDQQCGYYERDLHDRNLGGRVRPAGAPPQAQPNNPYRINRGRLWYTWDYMETIHKFIKVPMLVKGILTAEDAELCVQHGMAGIIVSNHGGRSLDYDPSTFEVLPEIVAAVHGRILVLTDSGYRRGTDILKALALGANAVCLGRATRWALGAFGAPGVQRVLEILQAELVQAAAANGRSTLASIDKTLVRTNFP